MTIEAGASYTVQSNETLNFANSDTLIADITNGLAQVNDSVADISGISNQIDYLKGIVISPKDNDGATIIRPKAAKSGWTYHLTAPEFTTSTINSLYHKDIAGNDLNESWVKFYDVNNTELTTQGSCDTDCVKTVFTFEPAWDYEIIGGTIKTFNDITDNIRIWVVAVPDVPAIYGGSKVMAQNINLKFIDSNNGIEADGRVSKFMQYSNTYHTNKVQMTVRHPAGAKEAMMMAFEVFKA
jgi:hypothetical protein